MSVAHELDMGGEHTLPAPVEFISPEARDWYLEEEYGYFAPAELIELSIANKYKARVAQLQMIATRSLCDNADEYREWLGVYNYIIGPSDRNSA